MMGRTELPWLLWGRHVRPLAFGLSLSCAALFLLIRKMTAERVMEGLHGMGGKIMRTSFDETKEAMLREALAGASGA